MSDEPATPDDPSIPGEAKLWRRISPAQYPPPRTRPTSAAFDDRRGEALSVVLAREGLDPASLLVGHPGFGVAEITVGFCRDLGLGVTRDPCPGEPDHALVHGKKTDGIRKCLAKKGARLIIEPSRP